MKIKYFTRALMVLMCLAANIALSNDDFPRPIPSSDLVNYYVNMAEWYQMTPQYSIDSVMQYFNKAELQLRGNSRVSNLKLAEINNKKADFYFRFQHFEMCGFFAQRALDYYQTANREDPFLEHEMKFYKSISLLFNGQNRTALNLFLEAEKLVIDDVRPEVQAKYYSNKGYFYIIYDIDNQNEEIYTYSLKSLKIYKKLNDPVYYNIMGRLYSRFCNNYEDKNPKLQAYFNNESEKYSLKAHDPYFLAFHLLVREEIAYGAKKYKESKELIVKGIGHLEKYKLTNTNYYQYMMRYMGDLMRAVNKPDSAIFYYKKANVIAESIKYQKQTFYNLKAISEIYLSKYDFKNSMLYYQQYAEQSLKLEKEKSERSLKEYDLEKDVLANQADLQKTQTNRNILAAGLFILVTFLAFLIYTYQKQKKLNTLLSKRDAEKDLLLKEIHHRVKNNLTVISSLLESQTFEIDDENAKALMLESQSRVKSISMIHQKLYQNDNLATVEFGTFLDDLYRQIAALFQKPEQQVLFQNEVADMQLDIDTAVPLGLITNELLTNSFKYAISTVKPGLIVLQIEQLNEHTFRFIYKDNGSGLPENLDFSKVKSMGLRLIHRLAKQLSGRAYYEKTENFSKFVVEYKSLESRKLE